MDRAERRGCADDRLLGAGARQRGTRVREIVRDGAVGERPVARRDEVVGHECAVALEREIAPGERGTTRKLRDELGPQAARGEQRCLDDDDLDRIGERRLDEHRGAVGPRCLGGIGGHDGERPPGDRGRKETELVEHWRAQGSRPSSIGKWSTLRIPGENWSSAPGLIR